ncbi:MAG: 16S rRNA (uracil(1498)-N(3))-methyltransferase [Beijerinckiaceae bacterium]
MVVRYDFSAQRLFVEEPLTPAHRFRLNRDQAHYLLSVLRMKEGDHVLIFNGVDGEWLAELRGVARRDADLVVAEQTRAQQSQVDLDYCFAPLKHARLDYIVQKAVEMGAGRIVPILTNRTQVHRVNRARMRSNAIEAAEQCGIVAIPDISEAIELPAYLGTRAGGRLLIFCDEEADADDPVAALQAAAKRLGARPPLALLVGPEGGFDSRERASLVAAPNVLRLSLGPRILRADTAGVAALALVQAILGDWSDARARTTMSP